jgi:hypothetical protein
MTFIRPALVAFYVAFRGRQDFSGAAWNALFMRGLVALRLSPVFFIFAGDIDANIHAGLSHPQRTNVLRRYAAFGRQVTSAVSDCHFGKALTNHQ